MPNLFQEGDQLLATEMETNLSEIVRYSRGNAYVDVSATIGHSLFEQLGTDGSVMLRTETVDFIVTTAKLILLGEIISPMRDDTITRTIAGKQIEYQVAAPDPEPLFRLCGGSRLQTRVHTVKAREL